MVAIKVYVEGGGDTELLRNLCRRGFREFLLSAGLKGKMPRLVASGSRDAAYKDFETAQQYRKPNELPILLVDSEDAVASGSTPWQHLKQGSGWVQPPGSGADQAFLMVRCMETWFLADREALASFFGHGFKPGAIPQWQQLESVEKPRVFKALDDATAACGSRRYAKGKLSFELLARIRAGKVEAACPHAAQFIQRLRDT